MPSFLAKACHYWPFYLKFHFVLVGLFELGVCKMHNTLLTKKYKYRGWSYCSWGGFCLNIEKLVDTAKLHLVAEPLVEGVRVLEGLCHVCGLQQGLGACLCLWPIRNGRKRKPLAEHFFPVQAPSFAASENAEWDAVVPWLSAEGFTGHPFDSGHQRATALWAGYPGTKYCFYGRGYRACVTFLNSQCLFVIQAYFSLRAQIFCRNLALLTDSCQNKNLIALEILGIYFWNHVPAV